MVSTSDILFRLCGYVVKVGYDKQNPWMWLDNWI